VDLYCGRLSEAKQQPTMFIVSTTIAEITSDLLHYVIRKQDLCQSELELPTQAGQLFSAVGETGL
jgi:hypothetical protein